MSELQQQLEALKKLMDMMNSLDDAEESEEEDDDPPNRPTPAPAPAQPDNLPGSFINSGKQNIKGLTNQTGFVDGNCNGAINFGKMYG
ncbi:hypothetical protein O6P43_021847 [Quillaja saponaria]|uniref:Uncharacterized protein n=1 Tax=Quillaja saponaria TaxID=32244 RepID=A0AAD7LBS9_QUISA|nr:hypothetical protein O6P43_021847 [Quillaja saponaria]